MSAFAGFRRALGPSAAGLALLLVAHTPPPAAAQEARVLEQVRGFEPERLTVGGVTVLYSRPAAPDAPSLAPTAREVGQYFATAASFFEEQLGGEFPVTVAVLGPRDWSRLGNAHHALPWSSATEGLILVPAQTDLGVVGADGRDTTRAQRVVEVISLHQLGHVVVDAYLHPAGFGSATPPVRWFDELMASYLGHAYMAERRPDLATFATTLARDVVRRTRPRFTSLPEHDRHFEGYLGSPQGANTLGWYQNAFNLRAAELYDDQRLGFLRRARSELPWIRFEAWTTDQLLEELEEIAPGFRAWADELADDEPRLY